MAHPVIELTKWRLRELIRLPEAVFWVFAFPIILAVALGVAFKERGLPVIGVAVERGPGATEVAAAMEGRDRLDPRIMEPAAARVALRTGEVDLVVVPSEPLEFRFDSTRAEGLVARLLVTNALQESAGRADVRVIREQPVTEPGARYIDFLIPGLLGMNIMGTGFWGVGFGIVQTRTRKLLKRFVASPMRRSDFILGQMLARMVFLVLEVTLLVLFGMLVFRVPFAGSVVAFAAVAALGGLMFAGMGALVGSRVRTAEAASGLMNLVMMPMWILSGVFFSANKFPDAAQPLIQALPLTVLNNALRDVMLDGVGLLSVGPGLVAMALWTAGSFALALAIFRWN